MKLEVIDAVDFAAYTYFRDMNMMCQSLQISLNEAQLEQ